MPVNHINKIVAYLLMLAARLVSVTYADHPTRGDATGNQAVSDPSKSHTYLPLPPGQ